KEICLAYNTLDFSLLRSRHIGDDKILVRRDAEITLVHLRDRAQCGLLSSAGDIVHASVLYEQRQMPAPVRAFAPAITVARRGERERPWGAKLAPSAPLDLGPEIVETTILDRVLEPCVLAIFPIAPITLHGDDGLCNLDGNFGFTKAHHVRSARIGIGFAMGHAHATTDGDIPAG